VVAGEGRLPERSAKSLKISLGIRFAALVAVVLACVLGSAIYFSIASQRAKFLEVVGGASAIGTDLIGAEIEGALARDEPDEIAGIIARAAGASPVKRVLLLDRQGTVLVAPEGAEKRGDRLDEPYLRLAEAAEARGRAIGRAGAEGVDFVTMRALPNGPRCVSCHEGQPSPLGFLTMEVSLANAREFVRAQAALALIAASTAGSLVAALLWVVARRWVIRPVERIRQGLTAVEAGILDVQVDASGATPELQRVAEAFNAMSDRLAAARRAVERTHTETHVATEHAISLNTIASVLAHELRNPMAGIGVTLETLRRDLGAEHPHQKLIAQAEHQLERVNRELDDLLAYARPPREELRCSLDLGVMARRTAAFARPGARAADVELAVDVGDDLPRVDGESDRLEQVLLNLIQNAVHAVSERDRQGSGMVCVGVRADQAGGVMLTVDDDGPGVPPERIERIFEPFYTTRKQGTGLGLPLARRIVEYHGGSLKMTRSRLGGARFTVWLPGCRDGEDQEQECQGDGAAA